jgi:AP-4 complex subunit beta-1
VSGAHELSYTVLSHISLLIQRGAANVFENEFKHFFCKYNEPRYIKVLKIDILTMIATENNLHELLNELSEYVTDVDSELSRRAIRAIGNIAMRLPSVAPNIIR